MSKPHEEWTVLPHGPLEPLDGSMLTVVGDLRMPLMKLPRRMTVARLRDRRLVIFSAIALDAKGMAALEAFGTPAFLIVPNDHHRLDAPSWKVRYPNLVVVAPAGARAKIAKVVAVDTSTPDFGDPGVRFVTVDGTRAKEGAMIVQTRSATTLVLNDLVGNIRDDPGAGRFLLGLAGFAGAGPRIPRVVKPMLVKDKPAVRAQLLEWAELPRLKRILVSHGEPIATQPKQALRRLAASL